eukprot:1053864-Amphidinium_carterae.1
MTKARRVMLLGTRRHFSRDSPACRANDGQTSMTHYTCRTQCSSAGGIQSVELWPANEQTHQPQTEVCKSSCGHEWSLDSVQACQERLAPHANCLLCGQHGDLWHRVMERPGWADFMNKALTEQCRRWLETEGVRRHGKRLAKLVFDASSVDIRAP